MKVRSVSSILWSMGNITKQILENKMSCLYCLFQIKCIHIIFTVNIQTFTSNWKRTSCRKTIFPVVHNAEINLIFSGTGNSLFHSRSTGKRNRRIKDILINKLQTKHETENAAQIKVTCLEVNCFLAKLTAVLFVTGINVQRNGNSNILYVSHSNWLLPPLHLE
jgi:hypothetical protein